VLGFSLSKPGFNFRWHPYELSSVASGRDPAKVAPKHQKRLILQLHEIS